MGVRDESFLQIGSWSYEEAVGTEMYLCVSLSFPVTLSLFLVLGCRVFLLGFYFLFFYFLSSLFFFPYFSLSDQGLLSSLLQSTLLSLHLLSHHSVP